jgi:hypothetical protein
VEGGTKMRVKRKVGEEKENGNTCLVGNSAHEFSEDNQIVDDGGSKEGVFACVVEDDGVVASHENF